MRRAAITAAVLSAALAAAACAGPQSRPTADKRPVCTPTYSPSGSGGPSVMVVGDSISNGSSGDFTWRYRLYEHLRSDRLTPSFVGPYNDLFDNVRGKFDCDHSYAEPAFGQAHDATWGRTLAEEKSTIGAEVARYHPDYLLVLLGFNDLATHGSDSAHLRSDLGDFIAAARKSEPGIRIVLGGLPASALAVSDPGFAARVADYNTLIEVSASTSSTAASPIVAAPAPAGFDPAKDTWDGIHPNARGEVKIAAEFAGALATGFGVGTKDPQPAPDEPVGPRTAPVLTATSAPGKVTLTWSGSPGATGYSVFIDALHGRGFEELPLPLTATSSPWTGTMPAAGAYRIRLQAFKGSGRGAFSNTVDVSVPSS